MPYDGRGCRDPFVKVAHCGCFAFLLITLVFSIDDRSVTDDAEYPVHSVIGSIMNDENGNAFDEYNGTENDGPSS